jgi:hypothetical protein
MPPTPPQARETYGRIPLSFETNQGQTESSVNFLARGAGYTLFLKPNEAVFVLTRRQGGNPAQTRPEQLADKETTLVPRATDASEVAVSAPPAVLRMRLVGADAGAGVAGADESAGKVQLLQRS